MNDSIIEFNPKLPKLSKNEKAVLKLLVEAGKLIVPIYKLQEKQEFPKDLEKVAKKDSSILSPYTVVEKQANRLVAIPYHVKYANLLKPIASKLEEVAKITDNKQFGNALKIQAKTLLDGSYERATAAWLKLEPYILDISIGPIEYHSARLPFSKASYQAWVGVLDKEGTERLNRYKKITLSARRKALLPKERIDHMGKVKAKTIDVVLLAGSMAKIRFVGVNMPMNIDMVQKYGSEITIFNQPNDLRMQEQIIPTFNTIFPQEFRNSYMTEDLRRANLRYIAMHELAHSYLYYSHARENLQDLFSQVYELAATVLGLRLAGTLLLEDVITNRQLESMILAYISRSMYLINHNKDNLYLAGPVLGSTIFINFLLESGALKLQRSMVVPNFMKIFVSLQELLYMLEGLLASGKREDAERLIKKYSR